jgi:hypothetical protein
MFYSSPRAVQVNITFNFVNIGQKKKRLVDVGCYNRMMPNHNSKSKYFL